ncbi:MAG: hypothetical protein J6M27_06255, partial [Lachnospiraceae bacterium]|nr:hypothetical protein [Lachnospiraceae bacterium]
MKNYDCNWGNSLKSFLKQKNQDKLFLQLDESREGGIVSGKGYICNDDGKNEYVSAFDYHAKEIRDVQKGEFQGADALIIFTKMQTLYGAKNTRTILPGLKDLDIACNELTSMVKAAGGMTGNAEPPKASSIPATPKAAAIPAPAAAPTVPTPEIPVPAVPKPAAAPAPAAAPKAATPAPAVPPTPAPAAAPKA